MVDINQTITYVLTYTNRPFQPEDLCPVRSIINKRVYSSIS